MARSEPTGSEQHGSPAAHSSSAHHALSLLGLALLACGNITSSPHASPDPSDGRDSSVAGSEATRAGTANVGASHGGTATGGAGSSSGGVTLVVATAGTSSSNTPLDPGAAGEGGQPDYPPTHLCIYPEDIPENWGQGGDGTIDTGISGRECALGVLGEFNFMGCLYELIRAEPFDVDPFVGGHSHCCYASQLLACK